jgi:RHS repeat-associated protein
MAKITDDGAFSIVSDYLGAPVEAYDEAGKCVWSAELDIYGRVVEFIGVIDFVPFRYQGQYVDLETGLHYNRFRYYDPTIGQYTQQDPIGLLGGNPTLYGYVSNPLSQIDPFGLITNPADRAFLKAFLGQFKNLGGVYEFKVGNELYIGKANKLYRRLYQHLGKTLTSQNLKTLVVHVPDLLNQNTKDIFNLEAKIIADRGGIKFLKNVINSPGNAANFKGTYTTIRANNGNVLKRILRKIICPG